MKKQEQKSASADQQSQRAEPDVGAVHGGTLADSILQLQSLIGNKAVVQMLAKRAPAAQRKRREGAAREDTAPADRSEANRTGMPDSLKDSVETLSGMSMDDARVHYNSDKPAQVHAHAHVQGSEIHVARGQERHLAHEAWHVVQQKRGVVKATLQLKGVNINDDDALEREADEMGARAEMLGKSPSSIFLSSAGAQPIGAPLASTPTTGPIQRVDKKDLTNILLKIREMVSAKGGNVSIPLPNSGNKFKQKREEVWADLLNIAEGTNIDVANMSVEDAAEAYYKAKVPDETEIKFEEPPTLYDAKGEEIKGEAIDFEIQGLGKGRIAHYQGVNAKEQKNKMLAWMSHGLQVSEKPAPSLNKNEHSMGFLVGPHENLFRPLSLQNGGFNEHLQQFDKQRGKGAFPRNSDVPDMLVTKHDPLTDFGKDVGPRQVMGAILDHCDLAILIDFEPAEEIDEKYKKNKEVDYFRYRYPPLVDVLGALDDYVDSYSDILMLCCRTKVEEKMKKGGGVAPEIGDLKLQPFDNQNHEKEEK
jgi:hypothetical protein